MNSIKDIYELYLKADGKVITDTRKISQGGSLFIALSGPNFNGNRFAQDALDKGCAYAIVDDSEYASIDQCVFVEDSLGCLQQLAAYHRQQLNIPVIGITGSNGKTTTKELLQVCLSTRYKVHSTIGNFNNHIGVPLTILGITDEHDLAIIEMGTNNPGEIAQLAALSSPTHALITSIGKAHLEGLGSIEGVAIEKLSLFDFVRETGGQLFANLTSTYIKEYLAAHEVAATTYSESESQTFTIHTESVFPKLEATIQQSTNSYSLQSQLFGLHNQLNICAALTVGGYFDTNMNNMIEAIGNMQLSNNRTETFKLESNTIYLDAYNANPSSMSEAIKAFAQSNSTNKILILGDMFELGTEEIKEHQSIVDLAESYNWESIVLAGSLFSQTQGKQSQVSHFKTFEELKKWFDHQSFKNKEILLKGSRGMGLERLVRS